VFENLIKTKGKENPAIQFALAADIAPIHSGMALSVGMPGGDARVPRAHAESVARQQRFFKLMRFQMNNEGA
jgi:hypothetical protein